MLDTMSDKAPTSADYSIARSFSRLGWIGFWLQLAIGLIPVALLIYAILFGGEAVSTRGRFALVEYLTLGSLMFLAFTTFWFYRYTRLAKQAPGSAVLSFGRAAWIGVAASTIGIIFSAVVMMFEVTQLLLYFLRAPQAGVPVVQTTSGGPTSWLSAGDILSLMGLIVTMLVEILVLTFSLWLLFRSVAAADSYRIDDHDTIANESRRR